MTEVARLILGLRAEGISAKEINDFILWIETGEEQYATVSKSFDTFFHSRSQTVGKACVCHHSTISPPSVKLLCISNLGLPDC